MRNAERIETLGDEEHIVSVIVHIKPGMEKDFEDYVEQQDALERVTRDDKGRHILVVATPTPRMATQHIETIQNIKGVLSANMVSHYSESKAILDEEVELAELTELTFDK